MPLGKLTTPEAVAHFSVGQILERSVHLCPGKAALLHHGRRITYRELQAQVDAFASGLASLGVDKGERMVINLPNSPELVVAFCALAKLGAITTWCNPVYGVRELRFILRNSGATGIILRKAFRGLDGMGLVREAARDLDLAHVISVDGGGGSATFETVMARGSGPPPRPVIDPAGDLLTITYTSGATGVPKGAPYTHYQAIRAGFVFAQALDTSADDTFLACLPLYHSYGFICILMQSLATQGTIVLMERWDAGEALRLIEEERVSIHPAAPTHYIMEMHRQDFGAHDLSSLRAGVISGSVPHGGLLERIEHEYRIWCGNTWGASEMGPGTLSFQETPREKRLSTAGRPHDGEAIRVVHPETGAEVSPGTLGELTVKGWNVITRYWNNAEETTKHFDREDWFHTGDLGTRDEDGYVTIVGRLKEQINRGGLKVIPGDVEEELQRHPKISEVVVVGIPNAVLGEGICACVVPREGEHLTLEEIREFLMGKIAKHKLPDELHLMKEFPRLSGGVKVNKYGTWGIREMVLAARGGEAHFP